MTSHALARRWIAPLIVVVTMLTLVLFLASLSFLSPAAVNAAVQNDDVEPTGMTSQTLLNASLPFAADFSTFTGSGFSPTPAAGQLDSDFWSVTGFNTAPGAVDFGDTQTTGDFARGASTGGASTGGIYAFDVGGGDNILGIQPGGSDFTPGEIILRMQNDTGATLTQLDVSYDIFYNNDQGRANSLNLSYSSDNSSYTDVSALDFTTPEASDGMSWQSVARSTTISGLNIADGGLFYLKWTGRDETGGGSRDEYGIDNVQVSVATGPGEPDLTIAKDAPAIGMASERITYTIDVDNIGAANADDVMITDTLPTGVSYVSYQSSSPLTFTNSAPVLVWEAGTVTTDTEIVISLTVDLPASFTATITNTVQISTSTAGDSAANNSDTAVTSPAVDGSPDPNAPELLLSEILVTPTSGEFIEIHNPTTGTIDLTDVYLTDAIHQSSSVYYYNIVTGASAGGGTFSDFHARFPNGASIPAGAYQTIALNGSADFITEYGMAPTYELYDDASSDGEQLMLEAFAGSIANNSGLSNGDEVVILYYWDGSSDLVTDLDYVVWGDKDEGFDKTGIALDGSDADSISTAYRDDTAIASQEAIGDDAHDFGNSWQREDLTEGAEATSDGNGVGGDDETSEDLPNTWCQEIPTPNVATLCGADIVSVQKDGPANAQAGERITYTIEVDSFGPIDASDVVITDTLPSDVTFITYTSSFPITFTNNAPILVWATDSITTGTSLLIELSVDTSMSFAGSITNTVEITTSTPGDQTPNNQDSVITQAVGSGGPDPNAPSLLLTEVKAQPTAGEFVEIYNPTTGTIDLSDVYLTDATFAGGGAFYYNIVTGVNAGGGGFGDFHARFPAGATIPAGAYQTIALNGSANFVTEYGMAPTYELYSDGSSDGEAEMLEALPGSVSGQGGLSNDGEVIVLYYWNGSSDLVTDLDYTLWGDRNEAIDKTGIATDGPDADSTNTAYLDDTATDIQDVLSGGAHATANSWQREDMREGAEVMSGGNGVGGDNETSEDVSNTWCEELPSPGELSPCAVPDLLSIEKNGPAEANPSDTITYTIDVANVGDVSAENVLVIDTLPDDVTYVSHSSSTPLTLTNNAPSLEWKAGTMAPNSEVTISLTVVIDADFSAPLVNTVVVSSSTTTGDDPDNNSDEAVTALPTGGACGDPFTAIYDIQGNGASSPLPNGTSVSTEGIVVGDFQDGDQLSGFFLQDATGDGDAATSDGIFVYAPDSTDVAEGDIVRVTGEVSEFFGLTELTNTSNMLNCGTGNATPATLTLPVHDITDFEAYEGMLIKIPQELSVSEHYNLGRYGQVTLSQGGRLSQPTNVTTPGAAANALQAENDKRKIILDDTNASQNRDPIMHPSPGLSASNTLRGGDTVTNLMGVLNYRADEYRVEPIDAVNFTHTNDRPTTPPAVGGTLKVASFNVLNYFNGDGMGGGFPTPRGADTPSEFTRQRDKIITAILGMDADIIGLMEIENDGYGPQSAIQDLVNGLNAAAPVSPTYAIIDPGVAQIGTDAIAVGLIYKLSAVTPMGSAVVLDSTVDPLFNDDKNRAVLAQTFQQNSTSENVTVAVNHLKSKGSDCDDLSDPDTGDGQGNCNQTRTNGATALANWLATDPTSSGDPDFLIIGDLNAYAMEDPIMALKNAGYTNLVESFGGATAYSYVFDGQWGYLDHALSNASLTRQVTGAAAWHINADEPRSLDYNEEFQSAGQVISLYNNDHYRASDHDPVLVGLNLSPPPSTSNQPPQLDTPIPDITVTEGAADQVINLLSHFSDPESDLLFFTVMDNSKPEVVPSALVGQRLDDLLTLQFGTPGQTEIVIQAEEDVDHKTYQDSFMVTVLPRPQPTLSMSQSVSEQMVEAGQQVTYTLTISNSGPGMATNALISDTLPAGLTFVEGSLSATGLDIGTLGSAPPILASGVTIMPNDVLEISFMARVNDDVSVNQTMSNTAQLTASEMSTPMQASRLITVIAPTVDIDTDGVNDDIEDQVPNLNGEGSGDGNGDGVADGEQDYVTSLPNATTGEYVTFVVSDGFDLVNVKTMDNPAQDSLPDGVDFAQGVFDFAVTGQEVGQSIVVTLISHNANANSLPNSYWKYGPTFDNSTPHWYNFDFDAESGTGAQIDGNTITLHFVDGQRGDDDGIANGEIRDPGAPVMYQAPTAMTLTQLDAQSSTGMWYAGALAALLLISGCLWAVRRKEE